MHPYMNACIHAGCYWLVSYLLTSSMHAMHAAQVQLTVWGSNIGAHYTIIIIRKPQNSIGNFKGPYTKFMGKHDLPAIASRSEHRACPPGSLGSRPSPRIGLGLRVLGCRALGFRVYDSSGAEVEECLIARMPRGTAR